MSILYADAQPQVLLIQLIGEHENEKEAFALLLK